MEQQTLNNDVENRREEPLKNGLRIEILKNSIAFITPDGKRYFKNLSKLLERVSYAKQTGMKVFTFAPTENK